MSISADQLAKERKAHLARQAKREAERLKAYRRLYTSMPREVTIRHLFAPSDRSESEYRLPNGLGRWRDD